MSIYLADFLWAILASHLTEIFLVLSRVFTKKDY